MVLRSVLCALLCFSAPVLGSDGGFADTPTAIRLS